MESKSASLYLHLLTQEIPLGNEKQLQELVDGIYEFALSEYKSDNNSTAEDICIKTIELLKKVEGLSKGKGTINRLLANVYNKQGNFSKSLGCNITAAGQLISAGEIKTAATVYSNCGALLFYLGDRAGAYQYQLLALNLAEEHGLQFEKAKTLLNIAIILEGRREFREALKLSERARSIFLESSSNWGTAYSLAVIASVRNSMGDYEEGFKYHQMALDIRREEGNEREILLSLINLSSTLLKMDKAQEAEQFSREALDILNWPSMKVLALINLAEALLKQKKPELAMEVVKEVNDLFLTLEGFDEERAELVCLESQIEHAFGKHEASYLSLHRYIKLTDKLRAERRDEEISRMRIATEIKASLQEKEVIAQKNKELSAANEQLRKALAEVKTLSGMLPICSSCKKIRDDSGYWQQLESFISKNSAAQFSHGLCTDCMDKILREIED